MSDELVEAVAEILRGAAMSYDEDFGIVTIDNPEELARAAIAVVIERVERELDKCGEPCPVCHDAIRKLGESE